MKLLFKTKTSSKWKQNNFGVIHIRWQLTENNTWYFFLEICLKLKCRFSQKYFCKNEVIIQNQNLFKMEAK
jgi:hypothetical protein